MARSGRAFPSRHLVRSRLLPPATVVQTLDVSGSITSSGALTNHVVKPLSGSSTPAGALAKVVSRSFVGSITPAGALTNTAQKTFAGTLTPAGDVANEEPSAVPITVRGLGALYTPANVASWPIAFPAGVEADDLAICAMSGRDQSTINTVPTGWVLLPMQATHSNPADAGTDSRIWVYYKICDGTEDSTTATWVHNAANNGAGRIRVYAGVDPADPFDVEGKSDAQAAGTAVTIPSLDIVTAGAWAIAILGGDEEATDADQFAWPGTVSEAYDSEGSGNVFLGLGEEEIASASTWNPGNVTASATDAWAIISFALKPVVVVGETLDVDGTITPSGSVSAVVIKALAGSVASSGTLVRATSKALAGSLTPAGAIANTAQKPLTASLASTGSLAPFVYKSLAGTLTPTAAVTKSISVKGYGGSVTPDGDPSQAPRQSFAGSVASAATLAKLVLLNRTGQITPVSTVDNAEENFVNFGGTLTPSGALATTVIRAFAGSIASSATLSSQANKALAGAITPAATITRLVSVKGLAGSETPSGDPSNEIRQSFAGSVATDGALARSPTQVFAGSLASSAAIAKAALLSFSGGVASSSTLDNEVIEGSVTESINVDGSIALAGSLTSVVLKAFAGDVGPAGILARQANKAAAGSVTPEGEENPFVSTTLAGSVTPAGSITRSASSSLAASITPSASVAEQANKAFGGALTPSGELTNVPQYGSQTQYIDVEGTISSSGALALKASKQLAGAVTPAGTLAKRPGRSLAGTVSSVGRIGRRVTRTTNGSVAPSGSLQTRIIYAISLAGSVGSSGSVGKETEKTFVAGVPTTGSLLRSIRIHKAGQIASQGSVTAFNTNRFVSTVNLIGRKNGALVLSGNKSVLITMAGSKQEALSLAGEKEAIIALIGRKEPEVELVGDRS